jgi:hypothetical protein
MDDELRNYLEHLRQETMKAHLQTWFKLAALERRIDAVSVDNAASNAETRLHIDATVERLEQQFELFAPKPARPRHDLRAPR